MDAHFGPPVVIELPENNLDAATSRQFRAWMEPSIQPGARLILDMGRTGFVDSSGLSAILSLLRRLHAVGGEIRLCCLNRPVRALFELVRLHRVFEIFDTREEAIASFLSPPDRHPAPPAP